MCTHLCICTVTELYNTDRPISRRVSARNTTGYSQYVLVSGAYHQCQLIISKQRYRLLRAIDTIPRSSVILMVSHAPPSTSEKLACGS